MNIGFYVSVIRDDGRTGLLLGPYAIHDEALANVKAGTDRAIAADAWAHFYRFGTCKIESENPLPVSVFGK